MNDAEIRQWLRERGCPEHVWRAGREGLIESWRRFADEVERGYPVGLEDYRNDLDTRALIALLGLDDQVADADRRLRAALTGTDKRVWETEADGFWNFGYPKNASGDLIEDLRAEGLA